MNTTHMYTEADAGQRTVSRNILVLLCLCGYLFAPSAWATIATTITVNSTADAVVNDGNCTLREAIIAADTQTAVDACPAGNLVTTIVFAPSTNGTPIVLTDVGAGEDAAATGDLDITGTTSLTITGNGIGQTVIDGDKADRVFQVLGTASLTLQDLTVTNGAGVAQGGGIFAAGGTSLTLSSVAVTSNSATDTSAPAEGGGIEADGNFSMTGSTVSGNTAEATTTGTVYGGGLYLSNPGATVSISSSTVENNVAHGASGYAEGGGVENETALTMTDSVVTGNTANSDSGAAMGGGIDVSNGSLDLERVELSDNTAQYGVANVSNAFGGGLATSYPTVLINTTIAGNQVVNGRGGGVFNSANGITINAYGATIAKNSATWNGGGIDVESGAIFQFDNTLIADNTVTAAGAAGPDCYDFGTGTVSTSGYNLVGIADGCSITAASSDQVGTATTPIDPKLGSLQAIGGNGTRVLPLLSGSPAIDAADPQIVGSGGTCYSPDQVGTTRPQDDNGDGTAACDIGAVEYVKKSSGGGGALSLFVLFALLCIVAARVVSGRSRAKAVARVPRSA